MNILIPQCFLSPRKWPYEEPEGGAEWSDGVHQCWHHSCWTWAWKWSQVPRFDVLKFWNEWNALWSFVVYEILRRHNNQHEWQQAHQFPHFSLTQHNFQGPAACAFCSTRHLRSFPSLLRTSISTIAEIARLLLPQSEQLSIFDKIALRLGNLTLKDRQHRQCVVCLVWPLGLLCLYLRCFNEDWDKMFF